MILESEIEVVIDRALNEDVSCGDSTSEAVIPKNLTGKAMVYAKETCILAGVELASSVFNRIDPSLCVTIIEVDGAELNAGRRVLEISGKIGSILRAERTAVNFIQHLSGIATETRRYVMQVDGFNAKILDTRKTIPGLRTLQKYAVTVGGGVNHRQNLSDGVLIKDNHIAALARQGLELNDVISLARSKAPHSLKIEVEVENIIQLRKAIGAGADIVMLDNMSVQCMREAVEICRGRAITEASGGVNLENVRDVAATGVDLISVGAITHSSTAIDFSLEIEPNV